MNWLSPYDTQRERQMATYVYTISATLLILSGVVSLYCITSPTIPVHPLTISDVSAWTELPYLFLFSSVLIVSVHILTSSDELYDTHCKQYAVLGLLILIPSRTRLLSMIHCVGVYGVVHGAMLISIKLGKYSHTKIMLTLTGSFIYCIIMQLPLYAIMIESVLFILCIRMFLCMN